MPEQQRRIPRRIAQTVINSLKGGVVPRIGLPYITVGRTAEIKALLHDVDIVADGGASFRFIVGRYGSGKSFLLQSLRNYVMDRGFVVVDADLSPNRRLHGTAGQGLATYRELVANLATKTKPEGGALVLVLDRWISSVQQQTAQETGLDPSDPAFTQAVDKKIGETIGSLDELVHGFDFAQLLENIIVRVSPMTRRRNRRYSSGSAANTSGRPMPRTSSASPSSSPTTIGTIT
ncbi:biotin carboxylase [Bifidobacterium sp. GSD1FS]|uniref:Biotin carboxylase n=1 Tax=Bifidobacterium canis TaxID=2610880 RepID=A0A7K1J3M6_9BIFI|nr:biotin carboxylase [Bifidobacterium canis]